MLHVADLVKQEKIASHFSKFNHNVKSEMICIAELHYFYDGAFPA